MSITVALNEQVIQHFATYTGLGVFLFVFSFSKFIYLTSLFIFSVLKFTAYLYVVRVHKSGSWYFPVRAI